MESTPASLAKKPRNRAFRRALAAPVVILIAVVASCASHFVESTTFYHPDGVPIAAAAPTEDVFFTTADGVRLHAWYIPPDRRKPGDPPAPAIIHCHGNAGCVEYHTFFSDFLPHAGVGVLLFDYRGFGKSDRCSFITRDKLMLDTEAALDYLLTRPDVDRARIGVYGYSLGGAFALALAAERPEIRAVCTVSAFSGWADAASDLVPVLGRLLIPTGLDPIDSVARLGKRPYLAVHGKADPVINYAHAERLVAAAKAAGVRSDLLLVEGAGHADDALMSTEPRTRIAEFFRRELGATP